MLGEDSSLAITNSCQLGVGSCLLLGRGKFWAGMRYFVAWRQSVALPGKG